MWRGVSFDGLCRIAGAVNDSNKAGSKSSYFRDISGIECWARAAGTAKMDSFMVKVVCVFGSKFGN